jgi:hypothetical protein
MQLTSISANGGDFSKALFVIKPSLSQCLLKRAWIAGKSSASTCSPPSFDSNRTSKEEEPGSSKFRGLCSNGFERQVVADDFTAIFGSFWLLWWMTVNGATNGSPNIWRRRAKDFAI